MANDLNVGSLSIKITENSAQAAENLQKLTQSLSAIKSATTGFKGLEKIANSLTLIAKSGESLTGLSNITEKLNGFVQGMNSLNGIQTPKMTKTKNAVTIITELTNTINSMPTIDGAKITALSAALSPLETIGKTNLGTTLTNLKKLPEIAVALNGVDFSAFSQRMGTLSSAFIPLETIAKTNLGSVITQLKKIPEMAKTLAETDIDGFATAIQRVTSAIQPLANEMVKVSNGFSALPSKIQKIIQNNEKLTTSNNKTTKSYNFLNSAFANFTAKMGLYYVTIKRVIGTVGDWVQSSNEYIENLNLFTVAMGDGAEAALEFAQEANEALGIDVSEFIRNQGIFQSVATGFGLASDEASLMSKNLTQLGYDISSFFNTTVEESMLKIQSGISGELEPLRRLGFALDQATLQQLAYSLGIEKSYSAMTQAEKAELRYYAIMTQQKQVLGDMARTITSPANAMRILSQQTEQLTRALGNLFIPILIKVLPYVQAFVKVLTEAVQRLAELMGFELPVIDYSDVGKSITTGITEEADGATEAVKTLKSTLAGIDQLNILSFDDGTDTAGAGEETGGSLGIDLPTYNFLDGLEEQSDSVYKKVKVFFDGLVSWIQGALPLIETLGVVLGGIWAVEKVKTFYDFIVKSTVWQTLGKAINGAALAFDTSFGAGAGVFKSLSAGAKGFKSALTPLAKVLITIGGSVAALFIAKNDFKELTKGTKSWKDILTTTVPVVGALALAVGFLVSPLAAVAVGVGAVVGALWGYYEAQNELLDAKIAAMWETEGTAISEVATAVGNYTTKLTESEQAYIDNKSKADEMKLSIQGINDELNLMILDITGVETISSEKVDIIKGKFEELSQATSQYIQDSNNNMKLYLIANKDLLEAQGINSQVLLDIINSGTENSLSRIEELQNKAAEITSRNFSTEGDVELFANLKDQMLAISGIENGLPNISALTKDLSAFADMEFNLESPESFTTSMETIAAKIGEAYATIGTAKEEMLSQISTLDVSDFDRAKLKESVEFLFEYKKSDLTKAVSPVLKNIKSQVDLLSNDAKSEIIETMQSQTAIRFWGELWGDGFNEQYKKATNEKLPEFARDFNTSFDSVMSQYDSTINVADILYFDGEQATNYFQDWAKNLSLEVSVTPTIDYTKKPPGMPETVWEYMHPNGMSGYATGGFPETGQVFMARENGIPEMVGTIGGQTAVANNDQIVQAVSAGVENAVYRAMSAANSGNSGEDGTSVAIYLDGDLIYDGVQRRQRQELIRSNGRA